VDRITRNKLKTDRFAVEVEHSVEFVAEHRKQVIQYGAIAVVVALIVAGIWYYRSRQSEQRQEELAKAMEIIQAPVSAGAPPGQLFFATEALKSAAAEKAFKPIYEKYSGTPEAIVSASYLGAISADQGKLADAEKYFRQVADSGDSNYGSMGKLSLAQVLLSTGKNADAEKLLRSLHDKPTLFVSKEQAAIALARALAVSKPAEARKLLEPLRTERPAVSQTAITLLAELPAQ
jgi:predicted negative regulator of RcsB-dependent stress response